MLRCTLSFERSIWKLGDMRGDRYLVSCQVENLLLVKFFEQLLKQS
jgi:hypothetical protein